MVDKKKIITKTVNRSGKSLVKKALVVKNKTRSNITSENIKKMNEKVMAEKEALAKKKNEVNETVDAKVAAAKEDKKYK
ncbi:MAG: hypothetical protein PHH12_01455, partial [Candidatus Shapirobacteria bacterium]|nr:hypothetical protein [Candidatus Shapirobacteria bacterium]